MLGLFLGAKIRTSTTNSSPSSLLMSVLCSAWRPVVRESPKLGHGAGRGRHFLGSGFFVSKTWIEPNLTSQLVHRTIFWLVVWIFFYFSIQVGISSSQLTNSYFSEGWVYHQPVFIILSGCFKISMISLKSLEAFQS